MLDPRIYRAGLVAVALGVIVLAFSLREQQGALGTTLAPDAFNGQNAYNTMAAMASQYPYRRPGSEGDNALASSVAATLRGYKFTVSTDVFSARTADGTRTLQTVSAVRPGLSGGSIVVVAHRDALGSPASAELSGTATLVELARVLSGQTLQHTIVLVSTSGSDGVAGATRLARRLAGSVDAVLVLGDLAGTRVREPMLVPWSNAARLAPPMLRNTVAAALAAQAGLRPGGASLAGQFARLAFPLTVSEQGPFGVLREPAVLLSVSGERSPAADAPVSETQIAALGRTVAQSVSAVDGGPPIPAPSAYLLYDGKVIPAWAIRLLVLALILPVVGATIDGLARARRRGHSVSAWVIWVLAAALPFALVSALAIAARLTGLLDAAPPGPVAAGVVPLRAAGAAILIGLGLVLVGSFVWLRPFVIRRAQWAPGRAPGSVRDSGPGAAAGVLLVMCVLALVIWFTNPFAAALMIPALHLWMWVVAPDVRLRPATMIALLAVGLAPPLLVALYYALALGLDPLQVLWSGTLLVAGGHIGVAALLEWSVALGCVASVFLIALHAAGEDRPAEAPITVRGPISYAGPGSLGGTESALRR